MRDFTSWAVALIFLLAAFHTVRVRRDVIRLGRENGSLQQELLEQVRVTDNMRLRWERLASPERLARRAESSQVSILPPGVGLR